MFRLMYRQRRRILIGGLFTGLTMLLAFQDLPEFHLHSSNTPLKTWAIFILTLTIMTAAIMMIYAVFIAFFKRWRFLVELLPVFWFLVTVLEPVHSALPLPEYLKPFLWFAGWMLFYTMVYGTGLDDYRSKFSWRSRRSVVLPMAPEDVWPKLAVAEGCEDQNWEPIIHEVRQAESQPDVFDVQYKMGPSIFQHQTQTVLAKDENTHFRYRFQGDTAPGNSGLSDGVFDIRLEPRGEESTRLTLEMSQKEMLPRVALLVWFDDLLGDKVDGFRARLAGKRDWSVTGLTHREILRLS